jgi:hypothetical protein
LRYRGLLVETWAMTLVAILVNLLMIAFVASVVWRKLATSDSLVYWSAAAVRLTAGIALGLFYKYYYDGQGDTFTLFNSAASELVATEPRSAFFIYIIRIVNFITANNYWITSLWFSLFSFICSYRLIVKLDVVFPSLRVASRIALLFVPSVVFWSSGIVKESLGCGAVAILSMYFLSFMKDEKVTWKAVVGIIISLIILLNLKYYVAAILLPAMITAFIIKKIDPKKFVIGWYLVAFVLLCVGVSFTHPNFHINRFLSVIVENHNTYTDGELIRYYNLSPTWTSVLLNSPLALFSGLFRPMVFEAQSIPAFTAALENLVILALFIWKIKFIRMPNFARRAGGTENRLIVFAVVLYTVVLCIFLALSTPNMGTLSRYRVGFLSFFILLTLADHPILKFISRNNGKSSNHIRS